MPETNRLSATTRRWSLLLTRQPSVTGSADEAKFGPWFAEQLRADTVFGRSEIWTLPVGEGDARHCVLMLHRGRGRRTVIVTGHYDTVSIEDYSELRPLAIEPDRLRDALRQKLARHAQTPAEQRALRDFETDDFLPGRGLLDMKSGLAAGLAVVEALAADAEFRGNVLFAAVPDEENNSAGARALGPALRQIADERDLELVAAINLDAIADDGDGSVGRSIATGTIGKVLPTAFVAGLPAHSGFPLNGVNAAAIVAAIAARVEWAPELTDSSATVPGTPPSLLSIRDGKAHYDVTTPATAFAAWNVLNLTRPPNETMDAFERLCGEAANEYLAGLKERVAKLRNAQGPWQKLNAIPVHRFEAVLSEAEKVNRKISAEIAALLREPVNAAKSVPEQSALATRRVWEASGMPAPAIVTGFGSIPYLATSLSDGRGALRLAQIVDEAARNSIERYGVAVNRLDYFPGISDMSFFGEASENALQIIERNSPAWDASIRLQPGGGIPTINIGPWGRDYHTPLERLHTAYAFDTGPRLVLDVTKAMLDG